MTIDFHDEKNRLSYAQRQVDPSWSVMIQSEIDLKGKSAVDIACGGGIYTKALAQLGAREVVGIDSSATMLDGAQENCSGWVNIRFATGDALQTGLPAEKFDLVLERALIHHLQDHDLQACFTEAYRLLRPGGIFILQDRTPDDCQLPRSASHLRGYFFERYPKLLQQEILRRHESHRVRQALLAVGFHPVKEQKLWETRKTYPSWAALESDLLARTGRSILHELTDTELADLTSYIRERIPNENHIVEQDRWTIWSAQKPD